MRGTSGAQAYHPCARRGEVVETHPVLQVGARTGDIGLGLRRGGESRVRGHGTRREATLCLAPHWGSMLGCDVLGCLCLLQAIPCSPYLEPWDPSWRRRQPQQQQQQSQPQQQAQAGKDPDAAAGAAAPAAGALHSSHSHSSSSSGCWGNGCLSGGQRQA